MCDKVFYEPLKNGCIPPAKSCPDCRKYFDRAQSVKSRVEGDIDYKFIRQLLDRDTCEYCGKKLSWEEKEVEHKTPVDRGGDNSNKNLCISCRDCNLEKSDRTYEEYLAYRKTLQITASDIRSFLDILSKHTLLLTKEHFDESVVEKAKDNAAIKNKIIRDDSGKIIGLRKIIPETNKVFIRKKITETHLTEWGEIYNAFCRLVNRKQLSETYNEEIIESTIIEH